MRLPSKDSAVARALRVVVYTVIPTFLAIAADPEVVRAVEQYVPWLLPVLISGPPIIAFAYNVIRRDVKNY